MLATQINITSTTIDAALADARLTVCDHCFVTVPVLTGICERCAD